MPKSILIPFERYTALLKRTSATNGDLNGIDLDNVDRLDADLILLSIPKTYRGKASALLAHCRDFLQWNVRGELVIDGKVNPMSNITDLLKDLYRREYVGEPPLGANVFWTILKNANAPMSLILNEDRKIRLQQLQQQLPTMRTGVPESDKTPPPTTNGLIHRIAEQPMENPSQIPIVTLLPKMVNPKPSTPLTSNPKPPRWIAY
jgi:hypothetical protein